MQSSAEQDLTRYQNRLRFPPDLERQFMRDYAGRQVPVLRTFFILGLILYLSFSVLDYFALPFTYRLAWSLRAVAGLVMSMAIVAVDTAVFRRNISWAPVAWTCLASTSIIIMIYYAHASEAGFTYYAFGLMLTTIAIYIPSSGSLLPPTIAGWATLGLYMLVAIVRQQLPQSPVLQLPFFVTVFFLVGANVLCMILATLLVQGQHRDFLLRRVIKEQHETEADLRQRADQLLLNVLPATVAERLKAGEHVADRYEQASILFADIVGFTPFATRMEPEAVVDVLNEAFSEFDRLASTCVCTKIKTVGDSYIAASGLPDPCPEHAEVLVSLGLQMCAYFRDGTFAGKPLGLRVGVSTGPVMAAVVGLQRFSYDVWGDTVNTASRMETHGQSGVVQITAATYGLVKHKFECTAQGEIEIKGKGRMPVWHVLGPK